MSGMTWRRLVAVLVLAMLALLPIACGEDATSAEPVRTNEVDLPPSYRFDPVVAEVAAGSTITWTNNDHFTHSVKVEDDDDHALKPGESVSIAFDQPGEYDYICTYHPRDMRGKVIVTTP
jgi:plastocyanin